MSRVPRSQRGGEVIEPLISQQWFVKMEPLAKPALEAVKDGRIKIIPDRFEKVSSNLFPHYFYQNHAQHNS